MKIETPGNVQHPQGGRESPFTTRGATGESASHVCVRPLGVLMVISLVKPTWSIMDALTAPGTDSTAARLTERARFNGLGWAISNLEQAQYQMNPPKVAGSLAGGIPKVSAPRPASRRSKPSNSLPSPARIPSQAQPPLPGEGIWQPLETLHGQPTIRAAFLRSDSQHTSYLVGMALINQKLVSLTLYPGYRVPRRLGLVAVL